MSSFAAESDLRPLGRRYAECAAWTLAAVAMRLVFIAPYPGGWDDVDFALALDRFDLAGMQPHFPGYPIYILAGHLFYSWFRDPFVALSDLSAWSGGLTIVPLWLLFRRIASTSVSRLAVALYAVSPLSAITGIQPTSDALGSMLAAWLAYLGFSAGYGPGGNKVRSDRRVHALIAAGAAMGLLAGVRLSYAAFFAIWLWASGGLLTDSGIRKRTRIWAVAGSAGAMLGICAAWLTALVVSEGGLASFLRLAMSFTEGHFSDWGGAYQADSSLMSRAAYMTLRQIGAAGLGTVWPDNAALRWIPTVGATIAAIGLAAVVPGSIKRISADNGCRVWFGRAAFILVWIVPYFLWALFAQNIEKPRHIFPLLPPLLLLLAIGLFHSDRRRQLKLAAAVVWVAGTAAVMLPLVSEAHRDTSPMMKLAAYVKDQVPAEDSLIFTWEEKRVISYVSPAHDVIRLRKWADLRTEALQAPVLPKRIYATNALIEGMDRPVRPYFTEVAAFRGSEWLYPTYHTIVLYEGNAQLMDALR